MLRTALLGLAALGCLGCAASSGETKRDPARGAKLYSEWGGPVCHGALREGTGLAPRLAGLAAHWSEADLAAFLADPDRFRRTRPELIRHEGKFPSPMPAFLEPEPDRRAVARWLLDATVPERRR